MPPEGAPCSARASGRGLLAVSLLAAGAGTLACRPAPEAARAGEGGTSFAAAMVQAARAPPGDLRIRFTRSAGGVPPAVMTLIIEPDGRAVQEERSGPPGPPRHARREGRVRAASVQALLTGLAGVALEELPRPVVDGPYELFEIVASGRSLAFDVRSLALDADASYGRIQAALKVLLEEVGKTNTLPPPAEPRSFAQVLADAVRTRRADVRLTVTRMGAGLSTFRIDGTGTAERHDVPQDGGEPTEARGRVSVDALWAFLAAMQGYGSFSAGRGGERETVQVDVDGFQEVMSLSGLRVDTLYGDSPKPADLRRAHAELAARVYPAFEKLLASFTAAK